MAHFEPKIKKNSGEGHSILSTPLPVGGGHLSSHPTLHKTSVASLSARPLHKILNTPLLV